MYPFLWVIGPWRVKLGSSCGLGSFPPIFWSKPQQKLLDDTFEPGQRGAHVAFFFILEILVYLDPILGRKSRLTDRSIDSVKDREVNAIAITTDGTPYRLPGFLYNIPFVLQDL